MRTAGRLISPEPDGQPPVPRAFVVVPLRCGCRLCWSSRTDGSVAENRYALDHKLRVFASAQFYRQGVAANWNDAREIN